MDGIRKEYPRPQFVRTNWQPLNGAWEFEFDDEEKLTPEGVTAAPLKKGINVPFAYQTERSGIGSTEQHEVMWYRRAFVRSAELASGTVLLNFNAVDYSAEVWLNGRYAGSHQGGYTAFVLDVTELIRETNVLVVKATDRFDTAQPRGKQYWKKRPDRCWYHASSGIWQSVWLEATGGAYLDYVRPFPDIDRRCVGFEVKTAGVCDALRLRVTFAGREVKDTTVSLDGVRTRVELALEEEDGIDELHYWTVDRPNLYDVTYELLKDGQAVDRVVSYFGMRKISVDGDRILLNNAPFYQKLILDQGYWKDSDLTPPTVEALKTDIELCKRMGFNGARKHQKIEDPYYYYFADKLGFVVWGEMPSAYNFCTDEIVNVQYQYAEAVRQLSFHPSVITFVPMNESWGVRNLLYDAAQKNFVRSLYYLTRALAPDRLVLSNDGWELVGDTDFIGIHDYAPNGGAFACKYKRETFDTVFPMSRRLVGFGESCAGKPVVMTEYGGIALRSGLAARLSACEPESWGYDVAADADAFIGRYENYMAAIKECPFAGFCYTQLTDVKQEVNGLLDENHEPKFDPDRIEMINR